MLVYTVIKVFKQSINLTPQFSIWLTCLAHEDAFIDETLRKQPGTGAEAIYGRPPKELETVTASGET